MVACSLSSPWPRLPDSLTELWIGKFQHVNLVGKRSSEKQVTSSMYIIITDDSPSLQCTSLSLIQTNAESQRHGTGLPT